MRLYLRARHLCSPAGARNGTHTPRTPALLRGLQKVSFAPKPGETDKIPAPPNADLRKEICSLEPRTPNSFTFHFDGFHGNHKIKLRSYLLQHYIIRQTLSCFSTNVSVLGWVWVFFFPSTISPICVDLIKQGAMV